MNPWDLVSHYRAVTSEADAYSRGLFAHIDKRIEQLHEAEGQLRQGDRLENAGSVVINKTPASGTPHFTLYEAKNVIARIYENHPPGSVYIEIEQAIPEASLRKAFAIKFGRRQYRDVQLTLIGELPGVEYAGWEVIGDYIVESLLSTALSPAIVKSREIASA